MNWSFASSWSVILIGILVWCIAANLSWQNAQRRGTRAVAWLEGLRMVIVSLLVFTLFRPEMVQRIERTESPEIVILVDGSGSMATRDVRWTSTVLTRTKWINDQETNGFANPLNEKGEVFFETFSMARTNRSPEAGTDIAGALERTLKTHEQLRAVMIVSDGEWNLGGSPAAIATRFRDQDIPIFGVGVGSETALPDLVLERVSAPAYGLIGEQIAVPFKVLNRMDREIETSVVVKAGDRVASRKQILIPPLGELHETVLWSPTDIGENVLKLSIPVESGETFTDNNELEHKIAIRAETLKVLVVDSVPRWEFRFLRNALLRDPGVEMHAVLLHPELGPGAGHNYLDQFPGGKDLLAHYDVVFLGDIGFGENELQSKDLELLKGLVEQQASGLVFIPGRRGRQMSLLDSPIAELIPVVLNRERPRGIGLQNEVPLLLSSTGKGHLLTRFDSDEIRNGEIWKNLPGFFWSAAVDKSRPGSEVLGVHASMRNAWGRIPLLVTRSVGNGKVLYLGTDSAWRWRRGVEDKYHYRFWSQVVRWMSHQRHLSEREGIRLSYSPESPNAGETVFLQAAVLNQSGFPLDKGKVIGRVTGPEGRMEDLEFQSVDGGWGVYKTRFTPREGGEFELNVRAPSADREMGTSLEVTQPVRERAGQPAQFNVFRELAAITGGRSGGVDQLHGIVEAITLLPEPKPIEKRMRLWSNPWWGGALLLLLGIYWTGRKLAGML
tara:strand:+ start:8895 stop:11072 length:2178 start_codon:yes stop_codon:yes gene_type:complete